MDYYLVYQGSELRLVGYSDVDWGGDLDQRKSTYGYVFLLNKGDISWCSKKQTCIALSTMEAEFIACSAAVQEAVWLRRFFGNWVFEVIVLNRSQFTVTIKQQLLLLKTSNTIVEPNTLIPRTTTLETSLLNKK